MGAAAVPRFIAILEVTLILVLTCLKLGTRRKASPHHHIQEDGRANVTHTAQAMCFLRLHVVTAWIMCAAEHPAAMWHDPRRCQLALRVSDSH